MQKLSIVFSVLILVAVGCKKNDTVQDRETEKPVAVDLSIPADSVKLNPTGYAPLSALVSFTSTVAGKTFISVKGKHGANSDIENVFNDNGMNHSVQVIGLYPNYLNTVNVRLLNDNGDTVAKATLNIQTADSLPSDLPVSIVPDVVPQNPEKNMIYLVSNYSSIHPRMPLMMDAYGDIRWVLDYRTNAELNQLDYQNGIKRLRNGNFYFGDVSTDKIYEVDLLGQVLNTWDLSSTGYVFHHDIEEKPDGNFIMSADKNGSKHPNYVETIEDYVVEVERQTGSIKTVWDLKESLDEYRTALTINDIDWVHVNSVLYDSTDNTIIVSGRTQGVVKLTFDNQIKWIMGPHRDWGTNQRGEDLNQFLLTPLDAAGNAITDTAVLNGSANHPDFEWTWYQHSIIALPNGDLMFFDNGSSRNFNANAPKYSRAVEYKIDPVNRTIQQKWQYGKERGLETFANIVSSVQYLPNNNHVLFCPGFQVQNQNGKGGKIVEVDYATGQVVSQISVSSQNEWGWHRAKRISVYPQ